MVNEAPQDKLIDSLATELQPLKPFIPGQALQWVPALMIVVGVFTIAILGFRSDWQLAGLAKSAAFTLLLLSMVRVMKLAGCPERCRIYSDAWVIGGIMGTVGLFGALAVIGASLSISQALTTSSLWTCIGWVAITGILITLLLQALMARARPQYPRRLAVGCAISASMIGAVIYSLYCPVDALTYIVMAYGGATLPSIMISLLFASRLWRW